MDYREMMYAMGGPLDAYQGIDAQRSGLRDIPLLNNLASQDQSGFDRYTQAAQYGQQFGPEANFGMRAISPIMGLAGAGLLGANEVSKAIPGMQNLIGRVTGDSSFIPDESTSKPSWHNFVSGMSGLFEGMTPGLFR